MLPVKTYPKDRHPAAVYVAKLGAGSKRTMMQALDVVADIIAPDHDRVTLPWGELRYQHTAAIRAKLAERYAPGTANKILSALRGALKEAWRLGYMTAEEYQRAIDLPKVRGETLPAGRALNAGELRSLFENCADGTAAGARDAAILAVLYGGGLRRSEAVALNLSDYDIVTGELRVRDGKGKKDRIVYVTNGAIDAMQSWLDVRGCEEGPLFLHVNKGGKIVMRKLTDQAIRCVIVKRAELSNVSHFTPHDMRRTFISDMLDAGADVGAVQRLAGHSDVSTTMRYDRRPERIKRKAAEMVHVPYVAH